MPRKNAPRSASPLYWSAESWAFLSLRLFLGLRFLLAGLGKFKDEAGDYAFSAYYDGFATWLAGAFEKTDIPGFLIYLYAYSIGYLEIVLALLLLVGVKTKWALALTALTYVSLAYGQMVLGNGSKVNEIGFHLIFTTAALYLVRHNKLEALR